MDKGEGLQGRAGLSTKEVGGKFSAKLRRMWARQQDRVSLLIQRLIKVTLLPLCIRQIRKERP